MNRSDLTNTTIELGSDDKKAVEELLGGHVLTEEDVASLELTMEGMADAIIAEYLSEWDAMTVIGMLDNSDEDAISGVIDVCGMHFTWDDTAICVETEEGVSEVIGISTKQNTRSFGADSGFVIDKHDVYNVIAQYLVHVSLNFKLIK